MAVFDARWMHHSLSTATWSHNMNIDQTDAHDCSSPRVRQFTIARMRWREGTRMRDRERVSEEISDNPVPGLGSWCAFLTAQLAAPADFEAAAAPGPPVESRGGTDCEAPGSMPAWR